MPSIPIKFRAGVGLNLTSASKTQAGLLELHNAELDQADSIGKRRGYVEIPRTTTTSPDDELPAADMRAVYYRDREPLFETKNGLYSRRVCAGEGAEQIGTAVPGEIAQALAALDDALLPAYTIPVPLPGSGVATGAALGRLARVQQAFDTKTYQSGGQDIPGFLRFEDSSLVLRWQGGDVTAPGSFKFPEVGAGTVRHFAGVSSGYAWFGHGGTANRCSVSVYSVTAVALPTPALQVALVSSHTDVIGAAAACCFDGNTTFRVGIRDDAGIFRAFVGASNWPVPATTQAAMAAGQEFLYDGVYDGANGPRATLAIGPTFDNSVRYLAWPDLAGSAASIESSFIQGDDDYASGDILGLDYSAVLDIVASRQLALDNVDYTRVYVPAGPRWDIDFVTGPGFTVRYLADGPDLVECFVFDDEVWTERGRGLLPVPRDLRVASIVDGTHLVSMRSPAGQLQVRRYQAGREVTEVALPTVDSAAAAVAEESGAWAVAYVHNTLAQHNLLFGPIDGLVFGTAPIPEPIDVDQPGSALSLTIVDEGGGDIKARAVQWYSAPSLSEYQSLYSYSWDSATGDLTAIRTDAISNVSLATGAQVQLGVYPRILWAVEDETSGNRQVYEINTSLFVRVDPPTVALAGGNWTYRGPWTRGQLREVQTQDWGRITVIEVTGAAVQVADPTSDDFCVLQFLSLDDGVQPSIQALIYSTHAESGGLSSPVVVEFDGVGPHVSQTDGTTLALHYVRSDSEIMFQDWVPGDAISLNPIGIQVLDPAAPIYDTDGNVWLPAFPLPPSAFAVLIAVDAGGDTIHQTREVGGGVISDFVNTITGGPAEAVACYAAPPAVAETPAQAVPVIATAQAVTIAGGYRIRARNYASTGGGGGLLLSEREFDVGVAGQEVRAIACATEQPVTGSFGVGGIVSVEIFDPATGERQVDTYDWTPVSDVLIRTDHRSALAGGYREVNGRLIHWQIALDSDGLKRFRSGLFGMDARSGEIVTRNAFGFTEDEAARAARTQVGDANSFRDSTVLSYSLETGAVDDTQTASAYVTWDTKARPNRPALSQSVLVSAHAGYPRAYDTTTVYEQDWHETPRITDVLPVVGVLPAGLYQVAVAYEWYDAFGNLYRTAPAFGSIDLGGIGAIEVTAKPLQRTERTGVTAVCFRSLLDGAVYYRAADLPADSIADLVFTLAAGDDDINANAQLDQIDGGTLPSQPARVTDFMVDADFRLWSRDTQQGNLARFTIPAVIGRAPHWPFTQGLELSRAPDLTSIHEQDGRILLFSGSEVSSVAGGGPDAFGFGAYAVPITVPVATGAQAHTGTAQTPDGIAASAIRTPTLVTRGLQTNGTVFAAIYGAYEIDREQLILAEWLPVAGELLAINESPGRTFRWSRGSARWTVDTALPADDASVSSIQDLLLLATDGRVLVQDAVNEVYQDGSLPYEFAVSTPHIHEPSQAGLVHGGYNFVGVTVTGTYVGPHTLRALVFLNYSATAEYEIVVAESVLVADAAAGRPYVYWWRVPTGGIQVHSVRIRLTDSSAMGQSMRISALDVHYSTDNSVGEYEFPDAQAFVEVP